jgi:hypothetical protein
MRGNDLLYWARIARGLVYCTMLGLLDQFWSPVVRVTPLKTPFGLLIPLLQSQSHVTTITYNFFLTLLSVYTIIIRNVRDYNHLLHLLHYSHLLHSYTFTPADFSAITTVSNYHTLSHTQSLQSALRADCDIFFANSLLKTASLTVTPGTELNC